MLTQVVHIGTPSLKVLIYTSKTISVPSQQQKRKVCATDHDDDDHQEVK
jgi:hypothetical protein